MRRITANTKGFTLIELMIVVVIIGILAAMAMPRFMRATTKTKQSEAKLILKQIYTNERAYRQQSTISAYYIPGAAADAANPNVLSNIWIEIVSTAKYSYLVTGGADNFTATATANIDDDATVDTWVIDQDGVLVNTINDVLL